MSAFDDEAREEERSRVLANSAVMAAGTIVSRLSGFVRSTLLAAALGASLHADLFNIANTIPNMLYILLAGGVVNAVLVPQLVRAMKQDADRGDAYTNRIITLAGLFLGIVTILLVVAAPLLVRLFISPELGDAEFAAQRESIVDFARYCLPQVFFYGMYVLVGQVLNARGRFGPMMWAPIANNVISVAVLVVYLVAFGPAEDLRGAYTADEELLLGIGSTLGIAAQFAILVPYLRASGFRYRPRFDFLHTGLGHTFRLGVWTILFVVVNQVAYVVVVRLASGGPAASTDGTGYFIYAQTFLITMVPHSVITVSLATAILPRLAARASAGDTAGLATSLAETLRSALSVILPFALLLPCLALGVARIIWGYAAAADTYADFAPSLALFGGGLLFFTVHYLVLRGFYALELTRTVFWIQCAVAATNIVAALVLVGATDAEATAPALVLAYTCSYVVGAVISYAMLSRRLGGLQGRELLRFLGRLAVAAVLAAAAAAGTAYLLHDLVGVDRLWAALVNVAATCTVGGLVLLGVARTMHLDELTSIVDTITRRLPLPRRR